MTPQPDIVILADHSALLAIPAFAPAIVVVGVVIYIAMRDRRKKSDTPHSENPGTSGKDESP
jgi:hypothetical protein